MAKNCGHKVPCGCKDSALSTPPPCNTTGECATEQNCSESFCDECVVYCGETMEATINGTDFIIEQGQNMSGILQMLFASINEPTCVATTAINLKIVSKGTESITISWETISPIYVNVEWDDGVTVITSPLQSDTVKSFNISGLASDTEYKIRVITDGGSCSSVKLVTKTL